MAVQAQEWVKIGEGGGFYRTMIEQPPGTNPNLGFANQIQAVAAAADVGSSFDCNILPPLTMISHSLASQLEKQCADIDRLIALQNERLIQCLQRQRKEHIVSLIRRLEYTASTLIRQKEEDILTASKRTLELQDCLRRLQRENERWERIARESAAMAVSLNNTLEQVRESACCSSSAGDADHDSCRDPSLGSSRRERRDRDLDEKVRCRACGHRRACVLLLPCRHLCSCKSCEIFMDLCPVCRSAKKAFIEVLL
ncbi:hypothetical protein H6P81_001288 [Aristolochia fimbriata]|uniref:RING-type domain-containing protein n=1 Tax=Aristolochia fimbriata TaxID=158543 RepID=A0AAV7F6F3_ARIFI|nr:hypothetical protein H6P81_001288 [Aristolochia fimbriata]